MAGIDTDGFTPKTLPEIKGDLVARLVDLFGDAAKADPDLYPEAVLAGLVAALSPSLVEVWQLAQGLYDSHRRGNASGLLLDNLAGVVGLTRIPATSAAGEVELTGTNGTVIPAGSIVRAPSLGASFLLTASVTIGAGATTAAVIAEDAGALEVDAGTITEIVTPITGWTGVANASALVQGRAAEGDAALRLRMVLALQGSGKATDGAIRAALLAIPGVSFARVTSNRTLATDANGIPPKAFRAVIAPNDVDAEAVAQAIFDTMPAGIEPDGDESATVTTSQGQTTTVAWSWATDVPCAVKVTVTTNALYPSDGETQIRTAVLGYFSALDVGDTVRAFQLLCAVADNVAGLETVVVLLNRAAVSNPPVGTANLQMDPDERATLDDAALYVVEA